MHLAIKYHIYYIDILSPKKKIPFFFNFMPKHSWNTAKIGVKHQSIN